MKKQMKKTALILALAGFIFSTGSIGFAQESTKKASDERKDVEKNQQRVKDSIADFQKFKADAENKIADNQKKIAQLKNKKNQENKEVREKYDKKVLALEQKNDELKKRLDAYNKPDNTAWASFKREFNHDMDELGHALRDIGVDNAK